MPEWKQEIRQRLANLKLEPAREAAIVEELAQHLDDCYAELLAGGATSAEAYQQSLAELSESELLAQELRRVERQVAPESNELGVFGTSRRTKMIADLWQDLRFGARMLMKRPGFTLIAIITLALGIGANTAIFSVVNAVMLRPLPYRQPEQLVMVWERSTREKMAQPAMNATGLFLAWRERKEVFSDVAAFEDASISHRSRFFLTGGNEPERIMGALVSGNLFSMLGVNAALGSTFAVENEQPGQGQVVILSDAFWRRRFGADPDVIGKTIRLSGKAFTIIGVAPPEFKLSYPNSTELWAPLTFGPEERADMDGAILKSWRVSSPV